MASAPPEPSELHRLVIVLDGSKLKGKTAAQRRKAYLQYMKKMRQLAKSHGAAVKTKELVLKQRVITARKKKLHS